MGYDLKLSLYRKSITTIGTYLFSFVEYTDTLEAGSEGFIGAVYI